MGHFNDMRAAVVEASLDAQRHYEKKNKKDEEDGEPTGYYDDDIAAAKIAEVAVLSLVQIAQELNEIKHIVRSK